MCKINPIGFCAAKLVIFSRFSMLWLINKSRDFIDIIFRSPQNIFLPQKNKKAVI